MPASQGPILFPHPSRPSLSIPFPASPSIGFSHTRFPPPAPLTSAHPLPPPPFPAPSLPFTPPAPSAPSPPSCQPSSLPCLPPSHPPPSQPSTLTTFKRNTGRLASSIFSLQERTRKVRRCDFGSSIWRNNVETKSPVNRRMSSACVLLAQTLDSPGRPIAYTIKVLKN